MSRAAVFIGVDKTGNLKLLNDAAAGAARMHQWAIDQGMTDKTHAKLITDNHGKAVVNQDHIYTAIKEIIDGPGVAQLLVYFAGHGVYKNGGEHWLLSEAPEKPYAAVDVGTSVELARYCGIPYVVFISDACRVAPEGLQNQVVSGVPIFANTSVGDKGKPVDQFYACARGKVATEVKPLKGSPMATGNGESLYTEVLLEALRGRQTRRFDPTEWFEPAAVAGDGGYYLRPQKLETWLETEVPLRRMTLQSQIVQDPDMIPPGGYATGWIARIDAPTISLLAPKRETPRESQSPPETLRTIAQKLMRAAVEGDHEAVAEQLQERNSGRVTGAMQLAGTARMVAAPFGPDHFETGCGIKVRGARMVDFLAPRASAKPLGAGGDVLRIDALENPAVSVLLRFKGDIGTVIPAIPGFITALTFDEEELVDVAYEPSVNNWRWDLYKDCAKEVRVLRAIAASSSQYGRFHLDQEDAIKIAKKMQYAKGIDPTLAVYAAYAYYDLQAIERIREMSGFLHDDVGATFFDLALLDRTLIDKSIGPNDGIVPFVPLLSQGWAILKAHRVKLHPALAGIESTMRDSLWSLFDASGLQKLARAMRTREVR